MLCVPHQILFGGDGRDMGEMRGTYRVLVGKSEARRSFARYMCVNGSIILKWNCNKDGRFWTGLFWLNVWTGDGLF